MKTIILTQKNRLRLNSTELDLVQKMAYHSARLYNVGLYSVRQYFFDNDAYLNYSKNYHVCKGNENYKYLLSDTAQQILRIVERDMKSFFALLRMKKAGKYSAKVRIPGYKPKEGLSMILIQGRSARIRNGYVIVGFSKYFKEEYKPAIKNLTFKLPKNIQVEKLQELRIIPVFGGKEFEVEFVYKKDIEEHNLEKTNHLSIDFGLNNFATCFNSIVGSSFIINGRYIKSVNQRYNKERARLQSIKDQQNYKFETKRLFKLTQKRKFVLNDFFNRSVKHITDYCISSDIGSIVLGDFSGIKQEINIGKVNNQNFVQIPYGIFKRKLKSKCEQMGIEVSQIEESYTSKCSFLDKESIEKHETYLGKRVKRGLFRTASKVLVNADVNGSANILVKYLKSKQRIKELNFDRLYKGFVNNPVRVKLVS